MLPNEHENRVELLKHFAHDFGLAQMMLTFSTMVREKLTAAETDSHRARMIAVALLVQQVRKLRSIVALCELGHVNDAETITRTSFESFLNAQFVLSPPPTAEISKPITDITAIDTRIQDAEYRALLFAVWPTVRKARHLEKVAAYDELAELRAKIPAMQRELEDIRSQIGNGWFEQLRRSLSFPGLGVKGLAQYTGQNEMYDKIYPEWCFTAHASDALDNLQFDDASNEVLLMFAGDVSKLPLAISMSLGVFGCFLDLLNSTFGLGLENDIGQVAGQIQLRTDLI